MKLKTKIILLSIFTFGIYYAIIKSKAKKGYAVSNSLKKYDKSDINVKTLVDSIGGINNIESTSSTLSTLSIKVKDNKKINVDSSTLGTLGIKGMNQINNKIIFITGNNASAIEKEIKNLQ